MKERVRCARKTGLGFACGSMRGWLVLALMGTAAWTAQAQAVWQGLLRTAAGAPIAGAKVMLASTAAHGDATTGADGKFALTALPAGEYRLTIESDGKRVEYAVPVELAAEAPAAVITLSARGEITLATQAAAAQAATGGEQLSSQAVSELPLNKRDFSSLLLLAAGTMTDANGATNFTAQFAINGQRGVEATFAMDGADISDPEMGGSTFSNFNVDAVEGIDSSSGWMPAEVGRGASGFTNIHTRSGASGFHGSIFEFIRNSALDARNYFDHATPAYPGRIPPFRRNEFGFTNGGPVWIPGVYDGRKKTFYFVEYQGFRQVLGTTQVMPVPTAAERPSGSSNIVEHQLEYADKSTDTLEIPVPAGIAAVLARYPLPNLPTGSYLENTYATASKVATNANQFSLRIDHKFSSKDQFLARFSMDNLTGPTTNPDQTAIDPTFGVQYLDRQRNVVGSYTRTQSPRVVLESLISITRTTPGFPTTNYTDPAVMFGDGLFEAFNSAAGSVMQAYGNLFQARQTLAFTTQRHAIHAGFEARVNRDTTYFGITPNGGYSFGGGSSYANEAIASASGTHDIAVGDQLPDTLTSFLSGSPFAYSVALAPSFISSGEHIGPAAISREGYGAWVQDTWKLSPRLTLDYGIRWEHYTPIKERARRTSAIRMVNGVKEYIINPQPGYKEQWNGWMPRLQATWQAAKDLTVHAGGSVMLIQPNIWQDNFLTGSTPFAIYPRRVSSSTAPFSYGFSIAPSQLPTAYTLTGAEIFPTGKTNTVAPNTSFDLDRFEKDLAALTDTSVISALNLSSVDAGFGNGSLYTWTLGLEQKLGNLTADAAYVGTAGVHLPQYLFPNAYPGATAEFAKDTQFDSAGNVIGGFGVENVIYDTAHSSYHALQASISGPLGHGGPGIQASYTFSKSLDSSSTVIGGTGSTGAVASGFAQNPFDLRAEKGPSSFDVKHGFGLSVAQDLHMDKAAWLQPVSRKVTGGWELLSISSISSGSPFTVYAGVQETGAGSNGVDRPDQIAKPKLSTARKDRADYFGAGKENGPTYFSIPVFVPGGTGPNQGRFGTLGRNTFRGPAFYNFDFALIKDTPFGRRKSGAERMDLQFRSEFFNLFNIVNMGLPSNTLGVTIPAGTQTATISTTNGFGEISRTAGTSRQIQFSLKVIY
ncbi:MAG TPA: TonB-dependent receptor [Terracidiphilus sp.]|nr:TonB-dependent receptor [Terracidiphilus sp.]